MKMLQNITKIQKIKFRRVKVSQRIFIQKYLLKEIGCCVYKKKTNCKDLQKFIKVINSIYISKAVSYNQFFKKTLILNNSTVKIAKKM